MFMGVLTKYRLFLLYLNKTSVFSTEFVGKNANSNFMVNRALRAELNHADGQTRRN